MELSMENLAYIGLFFIVLALLWILNRSNVKLAELVPLPIVQELIHTAVDTVLDAADRQAALTETEADDELVRMIRAEVLKLLGEAATIQAAKNAAESVDTRR